MQYVVSKILHSDSESLNIGEFNAKQMEGFLNEAVEALPGQRKKIYQLQQEEGLSY